jgi:hypothetical protein
MASKHNEVVYVIGEMNLDQVGPAEKARIKIGKASDLEERLSTFRTAHAHPLALITTYPGGGKTWRGHSMSGSRLAAITLSGLTSAKLIQSR